MKPKMTMLLAGALLSAQFANGAEIKVNSDITSNTTWTKDNVYILDKSIFVKNGATLTIQPGTWILGTSNSGNTTRGSLVITRDGTIDAVGTKDEPIVFTAKEEYDGVALDPAAGDGGFWGGLVVLGNAPINFYTGPTTNANENEIEGFPAGSTLDIRYGGRDSSDSSGRLKYISIRYGGYEFAPAKEINGLTFGGVGRGTEVENIEIISNTDDGFEIFGGTVNWKRVAVAFCQDDSLDLDEGWQGFGQFFFSIQNADGTIGDRGGEWDGGNGTIKTGTPYTNPRLFNMTILGEGSTNTTSPNDGIYYDDNFAGQVFNSVFHDFGGVMVKNSGDGIGSPKPSLTNTTFGIFGAGEGTDIDSVSGTGVVKGVNPLLRGISRTPNGGLDPRPAANSPLLTAPLSPFPNSFFEAAPYRGAFGDENWLDGWSYLSQKGYLPAPVDPDAPVFSSDPKSTVASAKAKVKLTSSATGDGDITYQWFFKGKAIKGATSKNYVITKLTGKKAGDYYVEATLDGKFTSKSATATIAIAKLTAPKVAKAKVGKKFKLKIKSNFKANSFKAINLPKGLKINNKGLITGKPVSKGKVVVEIDGARGKTKAEKKVTFKVAK
jgi:hypothetical protein